MFVGTKATWEKILIEISHLGDDSWESLAPLMLATEQLLLPSEANTQSYRRLHFIVFELFSRCEGLSEAERLDKLLHFFFEEKGFLFQDASDASESHLSLSCTLTEFTGHPFTATLLFLHLAQSLQIPLFWIQSQNQSILKWHRSGRFEYLDFLCDGRKLSDADILKVIEKQNSRVEVWSPRQLYQGYMELLTKALEQTGNSKALLLSYSLQIHLDESNTHLLAKRAYLRCRLGYTKDAHSDLKRYFSFVEKSKAPTEIIELYEKVLEAVDQAADIPTGPGPIYH